MNVPQAMTVTRVARQFIVTRQGKDHVLYAGLLDLAHREGKLKAIHTRLLQAPTSENGQLAIVHASVESTDGVVFEGIGDASAENVGRMIAMHCTRMAETRAKARALRDFLNIGGAALEELGPHDESEDDDTPARPVARADARPLRAVPDDTLQRVHDSILEWVQAYHRITGEVLEPPGGMDIPQANAFLVDLQNRTQQAKTAYAKLLKQLVAGRQSLKDLTGEVVEVVEYATLPDADAALAALKTRYRAAQKTHAQPATAGGGR